MQICWIWQKVSSQDDRGFQQFLDNVQYKSSGILRYERVFGQGFVSTGGIGMPYDCKFSLSLSLSPFSQSDCEDKRSKMKKIRALR